MNYENDRVSVATSVQNIYFQYSLSGMWVCWGLPKVSREQDIIFVIHFQYGCPGLRVRALVIANAIQTPRSAVSPRWQGNSRLLDALLESSA
jgi:hypothetical protein